MMQKISFTLCGILLLSILLAGLHSVQATGDERVRKIVVFNANIDTEVRRSIVERVRDADSVHDLNVIHAQAVDLTRRDIEALKNQPGILRIDDDVLVSIVRHRRSSRAQAQQPTQTLPWGIERIGAQQVWPQTTASNIKVGILDTGIDLTHPDLQDRIRGSYNATRFGSSAQDDNGHGTHVAGIVAAADNTIGVVGAGPRIDLYAIKTLNRNGLGYVSDIIKGLDWAVSQRLDIVNLSIGLSTNVPAFQDAVRRAEQAGIVQVAAAGNENGGSVLFPAAYSEVIAVSSIGSGNQLSRFSSAGPDVELVAPGEDITSTYPGSRYQVMTGTSMAAPHVAGAVALLRSARTCGQCTPAEVRARLNSTATDLGSTGRDSQFGYGLVNVYRAVTQ